MKVAKSPKSGVEKGAPKRAIDPPVMGAQGRPIELLIVEDSPDDFELALEAFEASNVRNKAHHARDGVEALDFLNRRGRFVNAPRPDLILLDLNMSRRNGREVLAEIKQDPKLATIPVVVLTTSKAEEDILQSYKLNAAAYVTKPVNFDKFVEAIRAIDKFWFRTVSYPKPD